jgi:signal transduction histidine kinase
LRWTAWGACGSAHNPDCVLVLAQDITEVRNQHEQVLRADGLQALGRMAGSIAHDFNNLLTGILLYCDLMLADLGGQGLSARGLSEDLGLDDRFPIANAGNGRLRCDDRLLKYAEQIRSASIQATGIVQQLLTVTRPRNLEPHPLCFNTVVEEMRNLLLRLLGENIELLFQLDSGLSLVRMDPAQAQQILLNLVLNARDAMPQGGRIQVETGNCSVQVFRDDAQDDLRSDEAATGKRRRSAIPCVLFVVSDDGAGMNEETRRRIFQAYFTTKEQGKGSGLGLATVRNIVADRGGLVHVESAPEQGTRVIVLLPSADSHESLKRQPPFSVGAGKKC